MSVDYQMIRIEDSIRSLSYDDTNGYYVGAKDVKDQIQSYIENGDYDHIFIIVKLGDILKKQEVPVNDWIGLRWDGLFRSWFFKYPNPK